MIKVQIHEPYKDRNEPTFRMMMACKDYFKQIGIEFTNSNDFDYLFIGMNDFINKKLPLQESIEWGSENVEKLSQGGDYFLFDGSDSTSIMGGIEVVRNTNPIYYFKNQFLDFDLYKNPSNFGRWFWGNGENDLSYDLSEEDRNKMKLSGWNLGHLQGHLFNNANVYPPTDFKPIDVCAIYQAEHKENYEHTMRNDIPYTEHRKGAWDTLDTGTFKCLTEQLPYEQYISNLYSSKVCLSPFGMGEICFRDFEVMALNTLLIKPDMGMVITKPNIYIDRETYFSVKYDWSNLNEVIQDIMDNFEDVNTEMCYNAGKLWNKLYTANDYIQHYHDLFKGLNNINEEENG